MHGVHFKNRNHTALAVRLKMPTDAKLLHKELLAPAPWNGNARVREIAFTERAAAGLSKMWVKRVKTHGRGSVSSKRNRNIFSHLDIEIKSFSLRKFNDFIFLFSTVKCISILCHPIELETFPVHFLVVF